MKATTNFPEGFPGFQMTIDMTAEALGGHQAVRTAIANQFSDSIRDAVKHRLFGNRYDYSGGRWSVFWTEATDEDFRAAIADAGRYFARHATEEAITEEWESVTLGSKLVIRGTSLYLESPEHHLFLANASADDHARSRLHPAQTNRRDPWQIMLMKSGEGILEILKKRPDKAGVNAQGRDGALRSLIRFAELFL
jgi:hypothetical protein